MLSAAAERTESIRLSSRRWTLNQDHAFTCGRMVVERISDPNVCEISRSLPRSNRGFTTLDCQATVPHSLCILRVSQPNGYAFLVQDVAGVTGRIRVSLAGQNKSQQQLSSAIGLEPTKLSKSLSGRRRFGFLELKQIADYLRIPLDWLVAGDPAAPALPTMASSGGHRGGARADTRDRMIEAAWELIAQRGLQAVRVADVAQRAGVSTASVHYHFKTRQDLLEEALRTSLQKSHDRLSADLASIEDPSERLLHLLELQLPNSAPLVLEWSIWLQVCAQAALDPRIRTMHTAAYEGWLATIVEAIEYGRERGVFEKNSNGRIALRLTALVDGLGIQFATGRADQPVERMREILLDFVRAELITAERQTPAGNSAVTPSS